jgi:PAS domain S-box-containing protein
LKKKKVTQTDTAAELRRLAEERLAASGKTASHAEAEEESLRIVHELRVHQFELEMQNEELRKAGDQKEAALERYTDLYEFAPVSYFTLDRAGIIRNVNLTGASLIGIDRSHLNGRLFRFFVAHKARPTFADFLDKFFASPVKVTCELELLAEENSPRFVQIEAMADASGEECRIALIDITERKLAEDALGASEEKYRAIFECSRDAIMTLEPPFLMFTTGNPSTVKMFVALNEKEFISLGPWGLSPDRQPDGRASVEKAKEMIETAMREDTHFFEWTHKRISGEEFPADVLLNRMELKGKAILQATVRDITERKLTEAALKDREEKHRKVSQEFNALLDKLPVDLNEIVGIVEKFLVRIIGEDIVCCLAMHGEPIVVYADTHQLEQVLMSLATNARDAMPEGGDLMIATGQVILGDDYVASHGYGKPGRYALLSISDTGKGMDEDTCKNIFGPFFTTKEVGKGTGLGLAVVYGIIKQHEGYVNVYSEPGIGTTFKIYLPLITSEVRDAEIAPVEELLIKGTVSFRAA